MHEPIRVLCGAIALWLHDYRDTIATAASFLGLSALLGCACWLYQAICFVVGQ